MIHGKYIEVKPIIQKFLPKGVHIFYICAGRGLGKTYSSLDLCRELADGAFKIDENGPNKFLYLRRTGVEANSVASLESCPFKKYNKNEGYDISPDFNSTMGIGNFYWTADCLMNDHIGYIAALSTFANLRGIDFSDVTFILYDECLPETRNKRPLKDEGFLLLNMLETINRNRALEGKTEVVLVMLSNPIDLSSPFLSQLQITPILNNMILKGEQRYTNYERSLHIEKIIDHEVSREKGEVSMVYKFAKGTGFDDRALSGDFVDNDMSIIRKVDLTEYKAYATIENICIYVHKNSGDIHISSICMPTKYNFRVFQKEMVREIFYWKYKNCVIQGRVTYDNFLTKVVLEQMINYKPIQ